MKDAFYFPHFSNARTDRKIKRLTKALGIEGYGIYFMLLEVLREQTELRYPISDIDLLADEFGTSVPKIEAAIKSFGLFEIDEEGMFFSLNLIKYLEPMFKMKEQRSVAGKASALARRQKILGGVQKSEQKSNDRSTDAEQNLNDRSTTVQRVFNENEQKKRKEKKLKETNSSFASDEIGTNGKTSHTLGEFEIVLDEENKRSKPTVGPPEFEKAWKVILSRGSKMKALVEWKKLSEADRKDALAYLPTYVASTKDPQYIAHFERYLRNRYWEDKFSLPAPAAGDPFPWPSFIPIHDARAAVVYEIKRVDCDFPHEAARAWFKRNPDWEKKYGGAK
jgi:hypothetical protein